MLTVYGISNCNTVKKALDWLNERKIAYTFHDYKKKGIAAAKLASWSKQKGWETLLNKKGTTWRQLDTAVQEQVTNEKTAIALMQEKNSMIKRPLVEKNGQVLLLGFEEAVYEKTLY